MSIRSGVQATPTTPMHHGLEAIPSKTLNSPSSLRAFTSLKSVMSTTRLKRIVWCSDGAPVSCMYSVPSVTPKKSGPAKSTHRQMAAWYAPCPSMLNHICLLIIEAVRLTGGRSSSFSEGGSVASASDASESMMRLIHSICTAAIGDSWVQVTGRDAVTP